MAGMSAGLRRLGLMTAFADEQVVANYKALVCIFMSGGNDCNNTVVDINQFTSYSNVRGASGLGLAQSSLISVSPSNWL